jgi:5-methylcytosine-specific restriction endonuclease McrA
VSVIEFALQDKNLEFSEVGYIPASWPNLGLFGRLGCHIDKPWNGGAHWKGYSERLEQYNNLKKLLHPYEEEQVRCKCLAALIPTGQEHEYSIFINGVEVCSTNQNLKGQRIQYSVNTPVTICGAIIEGGGYLIDGRQRSYNIFLDLPRSIKEQHERQRSAEKRALFKRFRFKVIENLYRTKFFQLFSNKCYKCGCKNDLVIDHHNPIVLGGHFVPGNLVPLCRTCNGLKRDRDPIQFYTETEIADLEPLLAAQKGLFQFEFDWDYWWRDHEGYLIGLGVDRKLIHQIYSDPTHDLYIQPPSKKRLVISISAEPP